MNLFTLEVLQAVNDWQRGGSHKQKIKRGEKLKEVAQALPVNFRSFTATCYRQEAHEKDRVWQLLADNALPETIAAWTSDLSIAKDIKGGVPPPGLQGIIFKIDPPPSSVVLNLIEVYNDPAFNAAVAAHRSAIVGYGNGIGKYGATQNEVVIELGNLDQTALHSYGGYSSSRNDLAKAYFGREPTAEDVETFDELCSRAQLPERGEWWLTPEGTQDVLACIAPRMPALQAWKAKHSRLPAGRVISP